MLYCFTDSLLRHVHWNSRVATVLLHVIGFGRKRVTSNNTSFLFRVSRAARFCNSPRGLLCCVSCGCQLAEFFSKLADNSYELPHPLFASWLLAVVTDTNSRRTLFLSSVGFMDSRGRCFLGRPLVSFVCALCSRRAVLVSGWGLALKGRPVLRTLSTSSPQTSALVQAGPRIECEVGGALLG